ncbi:MAG: PQQ-binding-like beta-propeller repeat protein, partial [Vicinamibacterales bacterium]
MGNAGTLSDAEYISVAAFILQRNGLEPGATPLSFSTESRTVLGGIVDGNRAGSVAAAVYPIPGRVGTSPSPDSVRAMSAGMAPAGGGALTETPTAITWTYRSVPRFTPPSDAELADPPSKDWLHWRGNPAAWGYSALKQVNAETVGRLELAWVWGLPNGRSQLAPLVRDGVIFITTARNNGLHALDATDGTLLWEYSRQFPDKSEESRAVRTLALWQDQVLVTTRDGYLVALHARDGKVRWEVPLGEGENELTTSTGPLIADGKIINGVNGCGEGAASCFISARDARTGRLLWRTMTVPKPGTPGADTWGDVPYERRSGADVWNGGSWDVKLGLVFFGTAQAKPHVATSRGMTTDDQTLYANSTLALDVNDGHIVWHRTHVPGESLDLDEAYEQILIDVDGQPLVMAAGK